jgi:predicted nucleic acid-binding protein
VTHLLDTDTCVGVLRQRPGMVQRLGQIAPTDCAISMITVYELFCDKNLVLMRLITSSSVLSS